MPPILVMINGLPGNVARLMLSHALCDPRFRVIPYSLTGPEITTEHFESGGLKITLLKPEQRDRVMPEAIAVHGTPIALDFTHPAAVNANAVFYTAHRIPFVMGTTGGNRAALYAMVENSPVAAVISPNMAKQIVGFQAMLEYAAATFPGLFAGYRLRVRESHQQGKADTSGTAKAAVQAFNRLGVAFDVEQIEKERDPQVQKEAWGVPEPYLTGHGWHTYTLDSPDGTARFEFTHNVNGRDIYIQGTMDAVVFLAAQIAAGSHGRVFSMIDVLRG